MTNKSSRPNKNYILQLMRDDMDDPWGTAMAWAFACAESLTVIGAEVPSELGYNPSPFVRIENPETFEPESYEDSMVWEYLGFESGLTLSRVVEVQFAARVLSRYLDWLRKAGLDY